MRKALALGAVEDTTEAIETLDEGSTEDGGPRFRLSGDNYRDACNNSEGRCLGCGATADGVEPDAREYLCDECGEHQIYGIEELLLMGEVEILDEE